MLLPPDFREFVELMIDANVRFVMIGGFAYNLYRNPRSTGDIDFLVSSDLPNQQKLRSVLNDFGFGTTLPPDSQPLIKDKQVLMLGKAPFRIDLLCRIDGVTFEEVENTCRRILIDGLQVPVIAPKQLLMNKQSTGRQKDQLDAEELQKWLSEETDNHG